MISFGTPLFFQAAGLNRPLGLDNAAGSAQEPGALSFREIVIERLMSRLAASPAISPAQSPVEGVSAEAPSVLARLEWSISRSVSGAPGAVEELRSEMLSLVSELKAAWSSRAELSARNRVETGGAVLSKPVPYLAGAPDGIEPGTCPAGAEPAKAGAESRPAGEIPVAGEERVRTEFGGILETDGALPPPAAVRLRSEIELFAAEGVSDTDEAGTDAAKPGAEFAAAFPGGLAASPAPIPVETALAMMERAVHGAGRGELEQIATALHRSLSPVVEGESQAAVRGEKAAGRIVPVAEPGERPLPAAEAQTGPETALGPAFIEGDEMPAQVRVENRLAAGAPVSASVETPDGIAAAPRGHATGNSADSPARPPVPSGTGEPEFRLASAGIAAGRDAPAPVPSGSTAEAVPAVRLEAEAAPEALPAAGAGDGREIRVRTSGRASSASAEPVQAGLEAPPAAARQVALGIGADSVAPEAAAEDAGAIRQADVNDASSMLGRPARQAPAGTVEAARPSPVAAVPEEPALVFAGGFEAEQGDFMNAVSRRTGETPADPLRAENRITARLGAAPEASVRETAGVPGRIGPVLEVVRGELRETSGEPADVPAAAARAEARAALIPESTPLPAPVRAVLDRVAGVLAGADGGELKELEIRLDTAELGRVRVRFEVESGGTIRVEMAVSSQQAAQNLREGLPYLRQMIETQRLSVEVAQIAVGPTADFGSGGQPHPQMRWFDFEPATAGAGRQEGLDVAGIVRAGFTGRRSLVDVLA